MLEKLPQQLQERIKKIYTEKELEILESWFNKEKRKVTFRVNKIKSNKEEIIKTLSEIWLEIKEIPYLDDAFSLENWIERDLWNTDIYKEWKIYIQWISSQIPVLLLDLKNDSKVLDVSAAPWSKTTQIASIMWNEWEIIANELNTIRAEKLKHNISLQWVNNVQIIKFDARNLGDNLEAESFDAILADLPCSSEWRINLNNEKTYKNWDLKYIKKNYFLQKDILKSIIPLLKKDWVLVYSTCTIAPEENEAIVHFVLSNFPELQIQEINLWMDFIKNWINSFEKQVFRKDVNKSIRCIPNTETEWFFIAKFKKV